MHEETRKNTGIRPKSCFLAKPIAYQNERKTNSGYKHNDNDNDDEFI